MSIMSGLSPSMGTMEIVQTCPGTYYLTIISIFCFHDMSLKSIIGMCKRG